MSLITNHEQQALRRKMGQYVQDNPNLDAIIKAMVEQVQDEEDVLDDLLTKRGLAVAVGEQLDRLGGVLDTPRNGLADGLYRALLLIKIAENNSEGRIEELIDIFGTLMGATVTNLIEVFPAGFILQSIDGTPIVGLPEARISIERSKPAGVGINALIDAPASAFGFEGDPDALGFELGEWATAF